MTDMRAPLGYDLTVTDLFCGAGGSSIGAEAAGARLRIAANHWRLAIDTHNSNFPHADHDCADISQVNPRRYPRTDILIASPECTNHSQAKARKPEPTIWEPNPPGLDEVERSRATMWDVPRFAEHHRYQIVIVENVVEAARWAPFESWLMSMHSLGYEHRILSLNSFTAYPTPQSRDRIYVVFWRKGNRAPALDFTADAWCPRCEARVDAVQAWKNGRRVGRYRQQYVYRCPTCAEQAIPFAYPAATAIDWSLPTQRIGDRLRPLADATLRRIRAGLERYGPAAIVQAAGHTWEKPGSGYARAWPTTLPLPTQTGTAQHALVVDTAYSSIAHAGKVRSIADPLMTQTGQQSQALVVPAGGTWNEEARPVTAPFRTRTGNEMEAIVTLRGTHAVAIESSVRPLRDPIGAVSAGGIHHALLVKHYTPRGREDQMAKPVTEPLGSVTTVDHHSLVTIPFLTDYHGQGGARRVDQPIGTVDTRDRVGLVEPAIEVEDCGFRMLEPHEIGRAMAFPDEYNVLGNKRERVRQYGNAVTPPQMDRILRPCIESLA